MSVQCVKTHMQPLRTAQVPRDLRFTSALECFPTTLLIRPVDILSVGQTEEPTILGSHLNHAAKHQRGSITMMSTCFPQLDHFLLPRAFHIFLSRRINITAYF